MFVWNEALWFSVLSGAAVKGSAVLVAAWLLAALLRRRSAAARHLVWTAAFAAILALPFLSAALPVMRIPLPGAVLSPASLVLNISSEPSADAKAVRTRQPGSTAAVINPALRSPDWKLWLMLLWAAGTVVAFVRMLAAYAAAWRVRAHSRPLPDRDACGNLGQTLGIHRPVDLLQSEPGSMPITFGLRRAAILMPADSTAWSEDRRRIVLLHELAHVRRRDAATHFLAHTAMALYWWNPLAWIGWREFLKERERAADDLVLNLGTHASAYAAHLLEIARSMKTPPLMAPAAAAVARRSQLEGRLLAILDSGVDRTAPGRATLLAAALLAAATVLPLAVVRAQDSPSEAIPADIDAAIRVARSQRNFESLETAAQAATQFKKYEEAQKLLEAAVAIRAAVAGPQSVEYGVGLVKLGELKQKMDRNANGDLYAQAAQILGERPEAARALTHLALDALRKKDFAHAFEYLQHAESVGPTHAGTSLMWMAVVRRQEKNPEEADRLFQSALAAPDTNPADAVLIMRVYGQFLRAQGRADEAATVEARANSLQKTNARTAPEIPAGVYRVGKGVTPPVPVKRPEPEYSDEARAALLQGTVVVQVVIETDGHAHDIRIVRELGLGLDGNAIEAISQWQFKPGTKDGEPVPVSANIEVNFRLL